MEHRPTQPDDTENPGKRPAGETKAENEAQTGGTKMRTQPRRADSALVGTVTAGARATAREEVAVQPPKQPPRDDQAPTPQETETKMEKKMDTATVRFVVLSDTHNQHDRITVPDGDVLLHLGDVADKGQLTHIRSFAPWFSQLPHGSKFIIPGNHDRVLGSPDAINLAEEYQNIERCKLLLDETVTVHNIRIHGTSWDSSEWEDFSAWPADSTVSPPIDILLTHLGPYHVRSNGGSRALLQQVVQRRIPLHLFGHFHYGRGSETHQGTTFINCATTGNDSKTLAPPVVFDFDPVTRKLSHVDVGLPEDMGFFGQGRAVWRDLSDNDFTRFC
jgi:predicted phosphohydrolase